MRRFVPSKQWPTIVSGAKKTFRIGLDMAAFEYRQAEDIIASKEAAGRGKDLESLPRLKSFREYLKNQ